MRSLSKVLLVTVVLALSACTSVPVTKADPTAEKQIMQRVDSLLYRYAGNDQPGVVALLDPQRFVIMGSDLPEVIDTPDKLRELMSRDFAQWGAAKYSNVRNVDVRVSRDLATAFFVLDWTVGNGGPTLPIRLCTTWRKVNGEWLLTQSANAVLAQR
jgi:hypothetical protein